MRSINKKGQEKYYIIISLILGLMVLSLSLYFIFNEYFTEDEADWEICRQSVLLRTKAIESGGIANVAELTEFPFKCKTEVIEIDYYDEEKAKSEIADALASCHALYGGGELQLYTKDFYKSDTNCFVCSRIHFSEDVVKKYSSKLDIGNYIISTKSSNEVSYYDFLRYRDQDKSKVLAASSFDVSNGDILVLLNYNGNSVAGEWWSGIKNFFTFEDEEYGWSSGVLFFQPKTNDFLDKCDIIETIPA